MQLAPVRSETIQGDDIAAVYARRHIYVHASLWGRGLVAGDTRPTKERL